MSDGRSDAKYNKSFSLSSEALMQKEIEEASRKLQASLATVKEQLQTRHPDIDKMQFKPPGGIKHDQDKTEYHYFSPIAFEKVNQILTFGAKKYAAHNWRKGFIWSRPFNACMRHLWAWWRGEDKDPETGYSHLAHAMCCIMMLLEFEDTKPELDDRYKQAENKTNG